MRHLLRTCAFVSLLLIFGAQRSRPDDFVLAPWPGPTRTATIYPFLIRVTASNGSTNIPTIRYQQVYSALAFTNVQTSSIYATTMTFRTADLVFYATVPSVQINLSTTPKAVDGLSSVFSENVGPDDSVVLGPESYDFGVPGSQGGTNEPILAVFERPFRYNPLLGNLLLDVRIFDGRGYNDPDEFFPALRAYSSPTDWVSRVWATNVSATVADVNDSVGLSTVIQLSPIPSLQSQFYPVYETTRTNIIVISWPSQPSTFVLQRSPILGSNASWQNATNQIFGTPASGQRWIELRASSAGSAGFYRLVWPSGP
jgi:hypothetical protein